MTTDNFIEYGTPLSTQLALEALWLSDLHAPSMDPTWMARRLKATAELLNKASTTLKLEEQRVLIEPRIDLLEDATITVTFKHGEVPVTRCDKVGFNFCGGQVKMSSILVELSRYFAQEALGWAARPDDTTVLLKDYPNPSEKNFS